MKYKNKITGDIITAHLFDGDMEALKKEMPLLEKHSTQPILQFYLKLKCDFYVTYGLTSPFVCGEIDFEENFEPYIEPSISNAQQAIRWLEEGKSIYRTGYESHKFHLCKNGTIIDFENAVQPIKLHTLFMNTWQIYEEPQYKKVDLEYALCQYALTGMNKNIRLSFQGEEYYIEELVRNSVNLAKIDDDGGMNKFRDNLKGSTWRHYA